MNIPGLRLLVYAFSLKIVFGGVGDPDPNYPGYPNWQERAILTLTNAVRLAPVPYRGKPNQPIYVGKVAECVAEIKGISPQEVARQTGDNFFRCFSRVLQ